jgi:transcriptional regulator with XRE-family HTH domain
VARKVRTFISGDSAADAPLTPKHLTKQEFGRRLYKLLIQKGWTQSELARQAGLSRDSVSTYVRGSSLPEPLNLERLAKALDVTTTDLLPNHAEAAIDEDVPSLELRVSTVNGSLSYLRVNRLVSTPTAMKVLEILNSDVLPDTSK